MKVRFLIVAAVLALVTTDANAFGERLKARRGAIGGQKVATPCPPTIAPYNANFAFPAQGAVSNPCTTCTNCNCAAGTCPGGCPTPTTTSSPVTQDYKLVRVCGESGCQIVRVPVATYAPQTITPKLAPIAPVAVKIQ